eukprot:gene21573-25947_t
MGKNVLTLKERNKFRSWTTFQSALQASLGFYPELEELPNSVNDTYVGSMKDLEEFDTNEPKTPHSQTGDNDNDNDSVSDISVSTVRGSTSLASEVLQSILLQVTEDDANDIVRRCGKDGLKSYRKPKFTIEPQLFGQLANFIVKLLALPITIDGDPSAQLGVFSDCMSSIRNYGAEKLCSRTIEVMVMAVLVTIMPSQYASVVTEIGRQRKPTFEGFCQKMEYLYGNVLSVQSSMEQAHAATALKNDRSRQKDQERRNAEKIPVCNVCNFKGHTAEKCWDVNKDALEAYCKRHPERERKRAGAVAKTTIGAEEAN